MIIVNDDSFKGAVLEAEKPVVLEFYSEGCLPCRRMEPVMAEIDREFDDVTAAKINVSEGQRTAVEYGIMASPTFLFFKQGRERGRLVGVMNKDDMKRAIDEVFGIA